MAIEACALTYTLALSGLCPPSPSSFKFAALAVCLEDPRVPEVRVGCDGFAGCSRILILSIISFVPLLFFLIIYVMRLDISEYAVRRVFRRFEDGVLTRGEPFQGVREDRR